MGFKCGIIGLPNVGKSTLFNALTESNKAEAANYPFATIEPNVGRVAVPDERLSLLGKIGKSEKIIPSYMDFVDIAGLVQGASKGEGLGNKFLGHIREVDAIAHVVRCFNDENITHVSSTIDPLSDIEIINTELELADIETLESKKISSKVVNMHTVKPVDKLAIKEACNSELIVSVEEHNVIGGLGSAIAEYKSSLKESPKQLFLFDVMYLYLLVLIFFLKIFSYFLLFQCLLVVAQC